MNFNGGISVLVRNLLYSKKDYLGQPISALSKVCPCMPCWHVYHFPTWNNLGKRIDHPECWNKYHKGCPESLPLPTHIFYNSKKFQNRKKGDKFRCLRCGQEITFGLDKCNWIVVPYRDKGKIIEYLKEIGIKD